MKFKFRLQHFDWILNINFAVGETHMKPYVSKETKWSGHIQYVTIFSFVRSSVSKTGLCTFSFPCFFKDTILAFSTEFDILNAGLDDMLKLLLYGGQFRYRSSPCFKPIKVDLL